MTEHLNRQIENIKNSKQVYSDMLLLLSKSNIDHELYEYIYDKIISCDDKINKYDSNIKKLVDDTVETNTQKAIITQNLSKEEQIKSIFDKIKTNLRVFTHEDYPNIIYYVTRDNLVFITQDNIKKEFSCRYDLWKQFNVITESPERILNDIFEHEYNVSGFYTTHYHWRTKNFNIEKFIPIVQNNEDEYSEDNCTETYDLENIDNEEERYFIDHLQQMKRYRYSSIPYKIYYVKDRHVYMIEDIVEKSLTVRYKDFCDELVNISGLDVKDILNKIKSFMTKYHDIDILNTKTISHKNLSCIEKEIQSLHRESQIL